MSASKNPGPAVLIVDDQADVRTALRLLLKREGLSAVSASSPDEALAMLEAREIAVVLVDMNYRSDTTSGAEGLALIESIGALHPRTATIAMTAWSSVELAVEAMRRGAVDFIEKPWSNARVLSVVSAHLRLAEQDRAIEGLSAAQALSHPAMEDLIASSASMRSSLSDLAKIAASDASILLLGESGVGKSHIAKCIHSWSKRSSRAFVTADVGGLSSSLFESEMFGHVRGAFTDAKQDRIGRFEMASEGTLFLDEIGNLPADQQPKLLRALETGQFERVGASRTSYADVRTIAATNVDLSSEVASGRFRQDLFYRLNTFVATIPPLRARLDDIVPLARFYLGRAGKRHGRDDLRLASSAEQVLLCYAWPGNVRELSHVMERAVLLADTSVISSEDLRLGGHGLPATAANATEAVDGTLEEVEIRMLRAAIRASEGNLQRAADQLGITRQSLYRRIEKYNIAI